MKTACNISATANVLWREHGASMAGVVRRHVKTKGAWYRGLARGSRYLLCVWRRSFVFGRRRAWDVIAANSRTIFLLSLPPAQRACSGGGTCVVAAALGRRRGVRIHASRAERRRREFQRAFGATTSLSRASVLIAILLGSVLFSLCMQRPAAHNACRRYLRMLTRLHFLQPWYLCTYYRSVPLTVSASCCASHLASWWRRAGISGVTLNGNGACLALARGWTRRSGVTTAACARTHAERDVSMSWDNADMFSLWRQADNGMAANELDSPAAGGWRFSRTQAAVWWASS